MLRYDAAEGFDFPKYRFFYVPKSGGTYKVTDWNYAPLGRIQATGPATNPGPWRVLARGDDQTYKTMNDAAARLSELWMEATEEALEWAL